MINFNSQPHWNCQQPADNCLREDDRRVHDLHDDHPPPRDHRAHLRREPEVGDQRTGRNLGSSEAFPCFTWLCQCSTSWDWPLQACPASNQVKTFCQRQKVSRLSWAETQAKSEQMFSEHFWRGDCSYVPFSRMCLFLLWQLVHNIQSFDPQWTFYETNIYQEYWVSNFVFLSSPTF